MNMNLETPGIGTFPNEVTSVGGSVRLSIAEKPDLLPFKELSMLTPTPVVSVSPRVGVLLTKIAETPDLEIALWKVITEFLDLKIRSLQHQIQEFEAKWGMPFEEFSEHFVAGSLGDDSYAYHVESAFWAWEKAETLLQYYREMQNEWT
jgi:hypothetical protein